MHHPPPITISTCWPWRDNGRIVLHPRIASRFTDTSPISGLQEHVLVVFRGGHDRVGIRTRLFRGHTEATTVSIIQKYPATREEGLLWGGLGGWGRDGSCIFQKGKSSRRVGWCQPEKKGPRRFGWELAEMLVNLFNARGRGGVRRGKTNCWRGRSGVSLRSLFLFFFYACDFLFKSSKFIETKRIILDRVFFFSKLQKYSKSIKKRVLFYCFNVIFLKLQRLILKSLSSFNSIDSNNSRFQI